MSHPEPREAHVRAFVALEMEPRFRDALADLVTRLRPRAAGARWVRPEGIHLTLRFLGNASPSQLDALRPPLAAAAASCPAVEGRVSGLGTFPERGRPRVLWLGLELPPEVLSLQAACEAAAVAAGFPAETRPFRSHLTLARFRERVARPSLPSVDLDRARLHTLVLFRSELRRGGAIYTPISRFPLGASE
jgi:2'-5' RNA ligase